MLNMLKVPGWHTISGYIFHFDCVSSLSLDVKLYFMIVSHSRLFHLLIRSFKSYFDCVPRLF